jgi:hypothetical protein
MKILIITQTFPPHNSSGTRRWARFAEELSKSHQVVVVTGETASSVAFNGSICDETKAQVYRAELPQEFSDLFPRWSKIFFKFLRKKFKNAGGLKEGQFVEAAFDVQRSDTGKKTSNLRQIFCALGILFHKTRLSPQWQTWRPLYCCAIDQLDGKEFDCIIGSTPTPGCLEAARRLSLDWKIPWFADFRDPWAPTIPDKGGFLGWIGRYARRREASLLQSASGVFAVSQELLDLMPYIAVPSFELITPVPRLLAEVANDAKVCTMDEVRSDRARIKLVYGGAAASFSTMNDLLRWIEEIGGLNTNHFKLELVVYGPEADIGWVSTELSKRPALASLVTFLPAMSHRASLNQQKNGDFLILLGYRSYIQSCILTGKMLEYLSLNKPVLLIDDNVPSARARFLRETGIGTLVSNSSELQRELESYGNDKARYLERFQANIQHEVIAEMSSEIQSSKLVQWITTTLKS